jgi:hypothetical protein
MRKFTAQDISRNVRVSFVDNAVKPFELRLLAEGSALIVHIVLPTRPKETATAKRLRAREAMHFAKGYLAPGMRLVHTL